MKLFKRHKKKIIGAIIALLMGGSVTLSLDGTDWTNVGTNYNIPLAGNVRICTLDSLNITMVTQFGTLLYKMNFTTTP